MRRGWVVAWAVCAASVGCGEDGEPAAQRVADAGVVIDAAACAPADEICNALDDDCDGRVDEDADGLPLARGC